MPKNIPIEGGVPIGAPLNWNPDKHGPCGTLNVLIRPPEAAADGLPWMTSAYRLTPAEQACMAHGGVLFLSIVGQAHPVISMWTQDILGGVVGDGIEIGDEPAITAAGAEDAGKNKILEIGFAAMMQELDLQAEQRANSPEIGDADPAGQVWLKGTFAMRDALAVALEAIGGHLQAERLLNGTGEGGNIVDLPVMTLEAVGAEAQAVSALEQAAEQRGASGQAFRLHSRDPNHVCASCDAPQGTAHQPGCEFLEQKGQGDA